MISGIESSERAKEEKGEKEKRREAEKVGK